ncbi:hypothetical protein HZC09_04380 [Candidatus Micrarchaeota archaeon]|nr:hypothetical protein [Candidatus Micrarchaeota archaeon]
MPFKALKKRLELRNVRKNNVYYATLEAKAYLPEEIGKVELAEKIGERWFGLKIGERWFGLKIGERWPWLKKELEEITVTAHLKEKIHHESNEVTAFKDRLEALIEDVGKGLSVKTSQAKPIIRENKVIAYSFDVTKT